jgi:hypothetical protein
MLPENALRQHFETNFNLLYHHKLDIRLFDSMVPWERDVFLTMMVQTVEEENLRLKLQESAKRAASKKGPGPKKRR